QRVPRPVAQRWLRRVLLGVLTRRRLFSPLLAAGRLMRPLLPTALRSKIPQRRATPGRPSTAHARRMIVLEGCVQPALGPEINDFAARLLDRAGISLVSAPAAGCCGAVAHHLAAPARALDSMRANIDAWWPLVESGAEAIIVTSSACSVMVKEYAHLLAEDPRYAEKARRVSTLARDLCEVIDELPLGFTRIDERDTPPTRIAFHSPCTLQHGQQLRGVVERILGRLGYELVPVQDAHLCCGSAGTYSILQPTLSTQLRANKLAALQANRPEFIATANIGCLNHLAEASELPVRHWVELAEQALVARS
ncbi:MAG: glycolate oxidase subunit GlcF, partial [Gammaproteobacteria bacterium]|nr:glycolate oxidase subunit GlcF [Gammaproteobacteria bacterium]